jgi:hypothetical protein
LGGCHWAPSHHLSLFHWGQGLHIHFLHFPLNHVLNYFFKESGFHPFFSLLTWCCATMFLVGHLVDLIAWFFPLI